MSAGGAVLLMLGMKVESVLGYITALRSEKYAEDVQSGIISEAPTQSCRNMSRESESSHTAN